MSRFWLAVAAIVNMVNSVGLLFAAWDDHKAILLLGISVACALVGLSARPAR